MNPVKRVTVRSIQATLPSIHSLREKLNIKSSDRPRFRVSADRQAGSRRVRYVETNRPDSQNCTICQLDEENPSLIQASLSPQSTSRIFAEPERTE